MKNPRRQLIIIAAASIGVTLLFFVFILKPKLTEIGQVRTDVQAAESEETQLRADLRRLKEARQTATQTTARLARVSLYLPSTPDLPGFIRQVQDAATKASVNLKSIAPSQPTPLTNANGIQVIPISITVDAAFRRMEDFLNRMESLDRVVEITAVSLAPGVDALTGQTILDSTIQLKMFVVQPDATLGGTPVASQASPSPSASP